VTSAGRSQPDQDLAPFSPFGAIAMSSINIEKEIKFIASANTQIKYYNLQLPSNIFERLERFIKVLGVEVHETHLAPIGRPAGRREIYFDTGWQIANLGYSLSIRSHDGKDIDGTGNHVLILRTSGTTDAPDGIKCLTRSEYRMELAADVADQIVKNGLAFEDVVSFFPQVSLHLPAKLRFCQKGMVNIHRNWFRTSVDLEEYYVYIDRFNFVTADRQKHSEFYTEIDIERRFKTASAYSPQQHFHKRIVQLAEVLQTAFDIDVDLTPKYQRFREFCVSSGMDDYYFIGFDVSDYSNRKSFAQKHLSQRFHEIIRDELALCGLKKEDEPIKISIGDGAIIAMKTETDWSTIVGLLRRIKNAVARHNKKAAMESPPADGDHHLAEADKSGSMLIEYHTGIHYGSVYQFTDLNGMINLAGDGISTVNRVLNEAGIGRIMLSQVAHDRIIDGSAVNSDAFSDAGERVVKHDKIMHFYEFVLK
jgi:hypothetical protein